MARPVEAALTLPATSVWMARTLWVPSASEMSVLKVPPTTVVVARLSPASMTPSLSMSSNSSTEAPVSPRPSMVRAEVFLVMLSEALVPAVPAPEVSSASAKLSAVGAWPRCRR